MANWKEYKLGDIAELRREKFTPNDITSYPYIGLEHIEPKSLRLNGIGTSNDVSSQKSVFYPNDTLYGKLRPYFQKVYFPNFKGVCSTDIYVFKPQKGIDAKYLFYLLASDEFTALANSGSTGTRMPRADWQHLSSTVWTLPDLPTQTAIAEILSSLDDKIELNNKINQELENLAQTLFKRWFIDFEFPVNCLNQDLQDEQMNRITDAQSSKSSNPVNQGSDNVRTYRSSGGEMVDSELGEIPKGWEVKRLSEIIILTGGGTPKRDNGEYWNGNILWFSVQDVPSQSELVVVDTKEKITVTGLNNSSTKILPIGTTIITARGTVGKLALVASPMAMNQSCYGVNGIDGIGKFFNYLNLSNAVDELKRNTHGAVFDTITSSTFQTIKTILPDSIILTEFERLLEPLFLSIESNVRENQSLTQLRDTLLPKLISGELEVKSLNVDLAD